MKTNHYLINSALKKLLLIILLTPTVTFSQQDFKHYSSLISVGQIPDDFSITTNDKIKSDKGSKESNLSKKKERVFLEGIHYSIDQILHSGMVLYGDEITTHINNIAAKLLVNEPEMLNRLRFYTLKSNATNAFSTDQGIIFVTTGLIAQVETEAQLAYVLAHEIAHYKLKHVVESFDYQVSLNRKDATIEKLSQYSKVKEFEADKMGIKYYHAAGYSKTELAATFDVLNFSYLPFDEVALNKNYFNSSHITIPDEFFPKEPFSIKATEDDDDTKSSHPNILSRKSAAENEANVYANWGENKQLFGKDRFEYIRNLARFETVRKDIMTGQYVDALYSIYLLERNFNNSEYLIAMKAKAWLGIAQLTEKKKLNSYLPKEKELEGEIGMMQYVFRKLKNEAIYTLALRNVYDIQQANPQNAELSAIWTKFTKEAAKSTLFKISEYSKLSYDVAKSQFEADKIKDSTQVEQKNTEDAKLSKYEKIRKKKDTNDATNFDESKFYIYGITDVIADPKFITLYTRAKAENDSITKLKETYDLLSKKERKKSKKAINSTRFQYGITDLIVVEPIVNHFKKGTLKKKKSEKLAELFSESIDLAAKESGMNITTISKFNLDKLGTIGYNERSILTSYLSQLTLEREIEPFPVDYQLLKDIETNYGTSHIMFTLLEHNYSAKISVGLIATVLYCPPCAAVFIPFGLLRGNDTEFNFIVMDIDKGSIIDGSSNEYQNPVDKYTMGAYVYDVFMQFKTIPTKKTIQ